MKDHTLYYFSTCPYCLKVIAYLKLKGIEVDTKNIRQDEMANKELMQGGGKTQVPCLRITTQDGDHWMYESDDIIDYFSKKLA